MSQGENQGAAAARCAAQGRSGLQVSDVAGLRAPARRLGRHILERGGLGLSQVRRRAQCFFEGAQRAQPTAAAAPLQHP